MNDVTIRFLELYDYLIANSLVTNKADFMKRVGVSNSSFTEISKGRNNVGLNTIQKTVIEFPWINLDWLIKGSGSLMDTIANDTATPYDKSEKIIISDSKTDRNVPPTNIKNVPPTVPPTHNLGLPKVVTIAENETELITLVPHKSAAGYLNGYSDPEYVETLPTIRMPNMGGGTHRAFENKGHSMNPTLYNGSISIGRWVESLDDIRDRRIYIVVTKSEGIVTKRVLNRVSDGGKLILISDNQNKKDYPNIILDADDVLELWYQRANLAFEFPEPDVLYNRVNDLEAKVTMIMDQLKKGLH